MPPFNNQSFLRNAERNVTNAQSKVFENLNLFVFSYMVIILVVANYFTYTIRGYRNSLPYIKVNIILLLNCCLADIYNSFVSITVKLIPD